MRSVDSKYTQISSYPIRRYLDMTANCIGRPTGRFNLEAELHHCREEICPVHGTFRSVIFKSREYRLDYGPILRPSLEAVQDG